MEFKSEQKHMLISPRKARPVADTIRKLSVERSLEVLPFVKKRASEYLLKVIKAAVAAASEKGIDIKNLEFKEIQIGEGPRLKRGRPVSRGRWHPIKKRMSHIKVILKTKESKVSNKNKDEKNVKKDENKKIKTKTVVKKDLKKKEVKP